MLLPTHLLLATLSFSLSLAIPLIPRDVISSHPPASSPDEARYQPILDFDTDGCYYTSAIDITGRTNPGLPISGNINEPCRNPDRLRSSNVYSRSRCNNGWCAYMYEYYFEKDQISRFGGGHTHEWENIVVFVQNGAVRRAMPSCHGEYTSTSSPYLQGNQVKIVYHKDGLSTHCFRHASTADDAIENFSGQWFQGSLIGWDYWPQGNGGVDLRTRMFEAWREGVAPKLWDFGDAFTNNLRAAAGDGVPGFDPARDE